MSAVEIGPELPLPKPKLSNAERQRKYRENRRNARNAVTRDDRNAETVTQDDDDRNARNADVTESNAESNADDGAEIICPEQRMLTAGFNGGGDLVLRQWNYPDKDDTIVIRANNIHEFLDQITDICGIPRMP